MRSLLIFLLSLLISTIAQNVNCGSGGDNFPILCTDAQKACDTVQTKDVTLGAGETTKSIGGFGTAQVYLTRAKTSSTHGDLNALCNQIVSICCFGVKSINNSQAALQIGQQGSVQIDTLNFLLSEGRAPTLPLSVLVSAMLLSLLVLLSNDFIWINL